MSSIMRARSALTGRWEAWEVIGGSSPKPKVAGPSMLGIGCPDRHALPITHTSAAKNALTVTRRPPARAGSFLGHEERLPSTRLSAGYGFRKETIAGMRQNERYAPIRTFRSLPRSGEVRPFPDIQPVMKSILLQRPHFSECAL